MGYGFSRVGGYSVRRKEKGKLAAGLRGLWRVASGATEQYPRKPPSHWGTGRGKLSIGVSPSGDVYVTGNVTVVQPGEDGTTGIFWKNGSQITLGASTISTANGVFLYTH